MRVCMSLYRISTGPNSSPIHLHHRRHRFSLYFLFYLTPHGTRRFLYRCKHSNVSSPFVCYCRCCDHRAFCSLRRRPSARSIGSAGRRRAPHNNIIIIIIIRTFAYFLFVFNIHRTWYYIIIIMIILIYDRAHSDHDYDFRLNLFFEGGGGNIIQGEKIILKTICSFLFSL